MVVARRGSFFCLPRAEVVEAAVVPDILRSFLSFHFFNCFEMIIISDISTAEVN